MPQDFYTLEQAAQRLGLSTDKLVEMAKRREVRAYMDRGTQRFRKEEIEELARRRGMGSDVEVQLGDSSQTHTTAPTKQEDVFPFDVGGPGDVDQTELITPATAKGAPGSDSDVRLVPQGSNVELAMEVPAKPPSSKKLKSPGDSGARLLLDSDSDVRLVEDTGSSVALGREEPKRKDDSNVRLEGGDIPDSGVRLVGDDRPRGKRIDVSSPTDEINLDEELRKAEESSKPAAGKKATAPFEIGHEPGGRKPESSGDFDLAPGQGRKGPTDSVFDSSSEELALEFEPTEDVTKAAGTSGINLSSPSDKGVGLEDSSSEQEALNFELAADDSGAPTTPKPAKKGGVPEADSSSEFELTLDDEGGLAPLEESKESVVKTDMVLPLQEESSSEDIALQSEGGSSSDINLETSDFELALDEEGQAVEGETGSEVIVIDEEAEEGEATAVKPEEVEEVVEAVEESEELTVEEAAEDERAPATTVAVEAKPAEWGWISLVHFPTAVVMLFVGFLLFEMMRGIWSYNQPTAVGSHIYNMFSGVMKDK
jgi:excisionase family DNA binding protein